MEKSIKASIFAWIAATFFGILLIRSGYWFIRNIANSIRYNDTIYYSIPSFVAEIVFLIALIALIVMLCLRLRTGVLIAAAGIALAYACWMILSFDSGGTWSMFLLLASLALIVLIILRMKNKPVAVYWWFLPVTIHLTGDMIGWIKYGYFSDLKSNLTYMLLDNVANSLGLLFAGLWLLMAGVPARESAHEPKETIAEKYAASAKNDADAAPAPEPPAFAFCGRCGGRNASGTAFCQYCGADLRLPGDRPE